KPRKIGGDAMQRLATWFSGALVALSLLAAPALAQQPLKIGFGMSLTGPLAGNGKAALIAMEIWKDDVNARGGILGRKVDFVYFDTAMALNPKPQTIALVGADAEYPALALAGAREQVKRTGLKVVYDKSYPPNTVDYSPIIRAIQATNPDLVYVASYPPDSAG